MTGEAISIENERLSARVNQLFERLETEVRQLIRQAELTEGLRPAITVSATAALIMAFIEGQIRRFVRSDFEAKPGSQWQEQWPVLRQGLFVEVPRLTPN